MSALHARPLLPSEPIPSWGGVSFFPDYLYTTRRATIARTIAIDFKTKTLIAILDEPTPVAMAALRNGRRGHLIVIPSDPADGRLLLELADASVEVTRDDRGRVVVEAGFREIEAKGGERAIGRVVEKIEDAGADFA